ncbi:hypothetical protein HK098_001018 [Nowakowskiella sp. JEL0407]|nr:hypothetical protein HK098_001018 [Nowakowskiella sp. JEL0407]
MDFYVALYSATVFIGTTIQYLSPPSPSFFSDKRNPLNKIFVKNGWAWTSIPLLVFMLLTALQSRNRGSSIDKFVIRWVGATLYWFILTQWFFGHSVFDRVRYSTAACEIDRSVKYGVSGKACAGSGGNFWEFDISGHCFLLIHASLFIISELKNALRIRRLVNATPAVRVPFRKMVVLLQDLIGGGLVVLLGLWFIMLCSTSLYFHHWNEKALGTLFGSLYFIVVRGIRNYF